MQSHSVGVSHPVPCVGNVNLLFLFPRYCSCFHNENVSEAMILVRSAGIISTNSRFTKLRIADYVAIRLFCDLESMNMKRTLLFGFSLAMMATVAVSAESRSMRSTLPLSVGPALTGQVNIPMPAPLSPVPDPVYSEPTYSPSAQPSLNQYPSGPVEYGYTLAPPSAVAYQNVKYRGTRNIAPCAVPTLVQVPDPCNKNACCKSCVNVEICVPPCDPRKVRVTHDGNKVRYDYGKYAVSVRSIGNHVVVHYED